MHTVSMPRFLLCCVLAALTGCAYASVLPDDSASEDQGEKQTDTDEASGGAGTSCTKGSQCASRLCINHRCVSRVLIAGAP